MPREATQEAIERTEADGFGPVLGPGSITTMIHVVHRVGRPERSRVSLGEPPAFFEHDDLRRLREASQWDGSRSTTLFETLTQAVGSPRGGKLSTSAAPEVVPRRPVRLGHRGPRRSWRSSARLLVDVGEHGTRRGRHRQLPLRVPRPVDQFGTFSEHEERRLTVTLPELPPTRRSTLVFAPRARRPRGGTDHVFLGTGPSGR